MLASLNPARKVGCRVACGGLRQLLYMMQVAAIVAIMASRFKLALASGGRKAALERQTLDSILHLKGGMKMIFVPRASIGFSSRL